MDRNRVQTVASIAEIISAFGLIVSLLYAGYEFRRSTTVTSSDAATVLTERFRESNRLLIESPGLAEIVLAGRAGSADLSEADRLRFQTFEKEFFNSWEAAWLYHVDGILDAPTWADLDEYFAVAAKRRTAEVWVGIREDFPEDLFRAHVNAIMGTE
jgi:hypothetical protein